MELVGHDPFVSVAVAKEQGIRLAALDEVYAAADYITLHVGLTPQTTGMINEASIAKMKKGVRLVNCARGELVNEADLARGAASRGRWRRRRSMFLSEEPPKNSPLTRAGECDAHSARWRIDARGAGSGRRADRAAGEGISEARRDSECGECAVGLGRRICGDAALHRAGGAHGSISGAGFRGIARGNFDPLQRPHCGVEDGADSQWRDQGHSEPGARGEGEPGERGDHRGRARPARRRSRTRPRLRLAARAACSRFF